MKEKITKLKAAFAAIPEPLQKQVYIRLGFSTAFLLLFALVLSMAFDWMTVIPFAILSIFSFFSARQLFTRATKGEYVLIEGTCIDAVVSPIRKRTKSVTIQTDEHIVQIILRQRLKQVPKGVAISLYIAKSTQVFDKNGMMVLHTYIAIEIVGGNANEKRKRFGREAKSD